MRAGQRHGILVESRAARAGLSAPALPFSDGNGRTCMKRKTKIYIFDCLMMAALAFLFALMYELFVAPNHFAPSGVNGIATMIEYVTDGAFSVGYFSLIVNIPLCVAAFFLIDRGFAVKTFIFSLLYSVFLLVLRAADLSQFQYDAQGVDTIYPVLIAGAISGFVYGLAVRRNSSTGGADVIAKYVSKKNPLLNFFWINFAINAAIAAVSFFVYAKRDGGGALVYDYKPVVLCMLYCLMSSFVGNSIIRGSKSAYKFLVITPHADEIEKEIVGRLHHSATRISAMGAYSHTPRDVLICVINRRQIEEFREILQKYDKTFAFVETVNETLGNFLKVK